MKIQKVILALVIAVAVGCGLYFVSQSKSVEKEPEHVTVQTACQTGVTVDTNVQYIAEKSDCTLDIAYSQQSTKQPLLVCVHGGSWTEGSKEEMNQVMYTFSEQGYAVATVNYEFLPDVSMMDQITQVGDAVGFLMDHSSKYHIDNDRIVLLGFSAGAQLAMRCGELAAAGELKKSFQPAALVDISGPTDFEYFMYYNYDDAISRVLIERPEILAGVHNSDIVTEMTKVDVLLNISESLPPVLILHGENDARVPIQNSKHLNESLKELGVTTEFVQISGLDHELNSEKLFPYLNEFLKTYVSVE